MGKMTKQEFESIYELLTKKQRPVLKGLLQDKSSQAIANSLKVTISCVNHHISDICKLFEVENGSSGYTQRDELIKLFVKYKPEVVCSELFMKFGEKTSETAEVLK